MEIFISEFQSKTHNTDDTGCEAEYRDWIHVVRVKCEDDNKEILSLIIDRWKMKWMRGHEAENCFSVDSEAVFGVT